MYIEDFGVVSTLDGFHFHSEKNLHHFNSSAATAENQWSLQSPTCPDCRYWEEKLFFMFSLIQPLWPLCFAPSQLTIHSWPGPLLYLEEKAAPGPRSMTHWRPVKSYCLMVLNIRSFSKHDNLLWKWISCENMLHFFFWKTTRRGRAVTIFENIEVIAPLQDFHTTILLKWMVNCWASVNGIHGNKQ